MAKQARRAAGVGALPDDLLRDVLARVPGHVDIFRCAGVCRRWLRLIADPDFLRRAGVLPDDAPDTSFVAGAFYQDAYIFSRTEEAMSKWKCSQYPPKFFSRNRLSPRYINIATTIQQACWGRSTTKPKGTNREKEKECQHRQIDKNEDNPPPLRLPEKSYHTPSTPNYRVPNNTFNKEDDDDAAAVRTNPRVSPGPRRGLGEGVHPTPSRKARRRPRASPRRRRQSQQGFLPTPNTTTPFIRSAPPNQPPTSTRHHDLDVIPAVSPVVLDAGPRMM
jgi:hypothetical protein